MLQFLRSRNDLPLRCIICLLLVVIVWIVFGQTLRHEFVNYDDNDYVYENRAVSAGLTVDGFRWALTGIYGNNWHPLTTLSHMLDCQLYDLQPWGHHLTNVMLHAAAAVLLFVALSRLTDTLWSSAVVAALFAVHPLRVESVAWIAERKDLLSGIFFMLILWAYARFARSDRPSAIRYLTVIILFGLGLTCKPTLVTVPFVLLLLDYWPLQRVSAGNQASLSDWTYLILEKVPLFVLSATSCVITLIAQQGAMVPVEVLTLPERIGNAAISYAVYLVQTIYPGKLAVIYPYPENHLNLSQAILAAIFFVIVSVVCFRWRKEHPYLLVGWLWFLGMLVPMIGLVQVGTQPHADRYAYLSQIGLFLSVVWGIGAITEKWRLRPTVTSPVAIGIIIAFMVRSYSETSFWQNSETLWLHTIANTGKNPSAENNLGTFLLSRDRVDEALVHFQNAVRYAPDYGDAVNNVGYVLARKGNDAEAITYYETALKTKRSAKTLHNLAISLGKTGKTEEAIKFFHEALQMDPGFAEAHYNLGITLLQRGQKDEALAELQEALRLNPNDVELRDRLRSLGLLQ